MDAIKNAPKKAALKQRGTKGKAADAKDWLLHGKATANKRAAKKILKSAASKALGRG